MTQRPKRLDTLIINDDYETPSLMNPFTGQLLILNQVGKRIVELADGSLDVDAIAEKISQEFSGAEKAHVQEKTQEFLQVATEKGVVTWVN